MSKKICPIIQKECIKDECVFWREYERMCVFVLFGYVLIDIRSNTTTIKMRM